MSKHNGIIGFWKFAFCILILLFHARVFASDTDTVLFSKGSIGVEFFFLVSGFLLARSALNKKEDNNEFLGKETLLFIYKKIKNFFPYILVCFIGGLIVKSIFSDMTIKDYVLSIWDLTFLRMAGFRTTVVNGNVWYISAMLLAMLILYPLLRKFKKNFVYLGAPIIVIFLAGILNHNYLSLRTPEDWLGFFYKGFIRAFLELSLGTILYLICEKMKTLNFTKIGKISITLVEIVGFLIPFIMSQFVEKATTYDFIVLIIMSISIVIAFSEKTLEFKFFDNKIIYYLEKLSLPVYLSHIFIRTIINESGLTVNLNYYEKTSIFIFVTLIFSMALKFILDALAKKNYFIPQIKRLFIVEKA